MHVQNRPEDAPWSGTLRSNALTAKPNAVETNTTVHSPTTITRKGYRKRGRTDGEHLSTGELLRLIHEFPEPTRPPGGARLASVTEFLMNRSADIDENSRHPRVNLHWAIGLR